MTVILMLCQIFARCSPCVLNFSEKHILQHTVITKAQVGHISSNQHPFSVYLLPAHPHQQLRHQPLDAWIWACVLLTTDAHSSTWSGCISKELLQARATRISCGLWRGPDHTEITGHPPPHFHPPNTDKLMIEPELDWHQNTQQEYSPFSAGKWTNKYVNVLHVRIGSWLRLLFAKVLSAVHIHHCFIGTNHTSKCAESAFKALHRFHGIQATGLRPIFSSCAPVTRGP